MYIQPITSNENSFKSSLIVKDLKADRLLKFDMTKESAQKMCEKFASTDMLNDRKIPFGNNLASECLAKLRKLVAFFADSVGGNFDKEVVYPAAENFSAEYRVADKLAEINVPEHFSLRLEV